MTGSTLQTLNNIVAEELFERAAQKYVELLDQVTQAPKITKVMDALCSEHPDIYPKEHKQHYLAKLHNPDFNSYLEKYRGEYIQRQLAPRLLAAHMGHRIGSKALEQLMNRLDSGDEIATKDLIALAQLGFSFAEKVGAEVKQNLGDTPQVNAAFQQVLVTLPPELAEAMAVELIRRQRKEIVASDT